MTIRLVSPDEMADKISDEIVNDASNAVKDVEDKIKKRFEFVIDYFQKSNPNPTTELKHKNGYELLVATILSAQATDKRVNMITPEFFEKYPTPDVLAKADPNEVYIIISSVTYANNKTGYLVGMANMLIDRYKGKIPEDIDELQKLPGVGRKTANVIAATLFNKPVIAVDTHVMRVSERIGLTIGAKKPIETEEQLVIYTPKDVMSKMSHWLILHGRYVCTARSPKCNKCGIKTVCRYYEIKYG